MLRDIAPQTNPDSPPRSEPALGLHSRAASSVGVTSLFQRSQHRKPFRRRADHKKQTFSYFIKMQVKKIKAIPSFFSSSTLSWATLYLMRHPEVQDKVREEINRVIGKERLPSLSDKQLMPYTEAVIQEIQRVGNIAPFGLPHSTFKEGFTLKGKIIPK